MHNMSSERRCEMFALSPCVHFDLSFNILYIKQLREPLPDVTICKHLHLSQNVIVTVCKFEELLETESNFLYDHTYLVSKSYFDTNIIYYIRILNKYKGTRLQE